jgi:hypothetical protein
VVTSPDAAVGVSAISNLAAAGGDRRIAVAWDPPTSGPAVADYRIEYQNPQTLAWVTVDDGTNINTTYTIRDVPATYTPRTFNVRVTPITVDGPSTTPATAAASPWTSVLTMGDSMYAANSDRIMAPNGLSSFNIQTDGHVLMWTPGGATWQTGSWTAPAASRLSLQTDGHLVARTAANAVKWNTGVFGASTVPAAIRVTNAGKTEQYNTSTGVVVWTVG